MEALFVELPPFQRHRADHLDDDAYAASQHLLLTQPEAGNLIQGTGGLRKLRFADEAKAKAKAKASVAASA